MREAAGPAQSDAWRHGDRRGPGRGALGLGHHPLERLLVHLCAAFLGANQALVGDPDRQGRRPAVIPREAAVGGLVTHDLGHRLFEGRNELLLLIARLAAILGENKVHEERIHVLADLDLQLCSTHVGDVKRILVGLLDSFEDELSAPSSQHPCTGPRSRCCQRGGAQAARSRYCRYRMGPRPSRPPRGRRQRRSATRLPGSSRRLPAGPSRGTPAPS